MNLIDEIETLLTKTLLHKGKASIALSGGSSPINLYQGLSKKDIDWERITVTLIDDRLVPEDHKDSNQKVIKENLLKNKAISAQFLSLQDWCSDCIPDICVFGMGTDGHFASLFPAMINDNIAFNPEAQPTVITTPPLGNPLHPRITMSLSMILAIPNRILIVSGKEKNAILDSARRGVDMPIARLLAFEGTRIVK